MQMSWNRIWARLQRRRTLRRSAIQESRAEGVRIAHAVKEHTRASSRVSQQERTDTDKQPGDARPRSRGKPKPTKFYLAQTSKSLRIRVFPVDNLRYFYDGKISLFYTCVPVGRNSVRHQG